MTHICVSELTIIGSDDGLSPDRRQVYIWTSAWILLISPLGTNFSRIIFECYTFSFMKMHLKMSSGKWRPLRHGLNVLKINFDKVQLRLSAAILSQHYDATSHLYPNLGIFVQKLMHANNKINIKAQYYCTTVREPSVTNGFLSKWPVMWNKFLLRKVRQGIILYRTVSMLVQRLISLWLLQTSVEVWECISGEPTLYNG